MAAEQTPKLGIVVDTPKLIVVDSRVRCYERVAPRDTVHEILNRVPSCMV